ncbi:MAG TPA: VCBS repeat-containing protein [Vicinamibacterales bacterium]|nr:VCBS repeat-containing protein [Vicinamibacterales bacterium]
MPASIRTTPIIALACLSSILSATPPRQPAPGTFERSIAPFVVEKDTGEPYALPFLGGFDVPRPQFVDIDADGDHDLFVQEYPNAVAFFENSGSAKAPRYEWRTDRYLNLEIGEWYRFVDLDADGDFDLLSELRFSHVRFYRNTGSRTAAAFEDAWALKDTEGNDIFLDRQNIPAFVDLDCDKRLDMFVGRVEGTVARYEAERPGAERLAFIQEQFEGIEIIGRIGDDLGFRFLPSFAKTKPEVLSRAPSRRHGANALAFADFDGDQDQDLFWGDFFEPGVLLIENIGRTCSSPSFQVDPVQLPFAAATRTSGYNAPAPIDLDLDGDLDFLMGVLGGAFNPVATSADNFYFWERTAADRLELRTKRFLDGIDLGSETVPSLADVDGDGDLDLVVGNKVDPAANDAGRLSIFTNTGTKSAPSFRLTETLRLTEAYHLAPAFGDLDGDGDADMLLGTWNHDILLFRNTGAAGASRWKLDEPATIRPPKASHSTPALVDIDGDRDLDMFVGQANGSVLFYRNAGTPKAPRFDIVTGALDELRAGRRSVPSLADIDGDGRIDLIVGRESGGASVYRNAGSGAALRFVESRELAIALPAGAAPAFGDINGDGKLDLVSGTLSGGVVFYRGK